MDGDMDRGGGAFVHERGDSLATVLSSVRQTVDDLKRGKTPVSDRQMEVSLCIHPQTEGLQ